MPSSTLSVPQSTVLVLDDNPSPHLGVKVERSEVTCLSDLVKLGIVSSKENLDILLKASKGATQVALSRTETHVPRMPGTTRPDLRRFGTFSLSATAVRQPEVLSFWSIFRTMSAQWVSAMTADTPLSKAGLGKGPIVITTATLPDTVVEGVLSIDPKLDVLECNDLIIKKSGKIVIRGSGIFIRARSIQGQV